MRSAKKVQSAKCKSRSKKHKLKAFSVPIKRSPLDESSVVAVLSKVKNQQIETFNPAGALIKFADCSTQSVSDDGDDIGGVGSVGGLV